MIDFNHSTINWLTKNGSNGVFKLESVLTVIDPSQNLSYQCFLGCSVLAGNVYSEHDLLKKPAYFFQLLLTENYHKILRRPVTNRRTDDDLSHIEDSIDKNSVFNSIKPDIQYIDNNTIKNNSDFEAVSDNIKDLPNVKIEIRLERGIKIIIESPVRHFNYMQKKWQVESGPISMMYPISELSFIEKNILKKLTPCFLHSNNFGCIEITPDYPFFTIDRFVATNDLNSVKIKCTVQLLFKT